MFKLFKNEAKNKIKKAKKQKKIAKKIYAKTKTTLDWCDIEKVTDEGIFIGKGGKIQVKGIKLAPKNIFMMSSKDRVDLINNLRSCFNRLNFKVFFSYVFIPVNIEEAKANIYEQMKYEKSKKIQQLLQNDYNKLVSFKDDFLEIEFHLYVRESNPKFLEKNYFALKKEFMATGLFDSELNKGDYLNYINYLFENPMINDFYFTRGIYKCLDENYTEELSQKALDEIEDAKILTLGEDDTISIKSKFVPTSYSESKNYLTVGDKFVSNLLVTQLPPDYNIGLLSLFINNPSIKCFMTIDSLNYNLSALIKKDYNEKVKEYNTTVDPTKRTNLQNEIATLSSYLERTVSNKDKTFNLVIIFSISATNLDELNSKVNDFINNLNTDKFSVTRCFNMQDQIFRIANPVLLPGKLPNEIINNIGVPLSSESVSGLYPFIFETLKDKKGFLMGHEITNNGIILFDNFYYLNQKLDSRTNKRINGNLVIVGKSGNGKTTVMNMILRDHIRNHNKVIYIDPENKNRKLTKLYGGNYIEYGTRNNMINVFDLQPIDIGTDEAELLTDNEYEAMFDTSLAIDKVIEDISQILTYLFREYSDEEASIIGKMIRKAYDKVGIKADENGRYNNFKNLKPNDMPTFSTLKLVIEEEINLIRDDYTKSIELNALSKLNVKIERIIGEWSVYLNGHSTIVDNGDVSMLSFGVKSLFDISDKLKNALSHIMFKKAWSMCVKNRDKTVMCIDEAHVFILEQELAKIISNFARRARKYSTALILATQEPKDFADDKVLTEGKAIFNNSTYKLILGLDKDPVNDLKKLISLNDSEEYSIQQFKLGYALFLVGDRNIPIRILLSANEEKELT